MQSLFTKVLDGLKRLLELSFFHQLVGLNIASQISLVSNRLAESLFPQDVENDSCEQASI